jgi:hypothetical protein
MSEPPIGVTGPSHFMDIPINSAIARRYIDIENKMVPMTNKRSININSNPSVFEFKPITNKETP